MQSHVLKTPDYKDYDFAFIIACIHVLVILLQNRHKQVYMCYAYDHNLSVFTWKGPYAMLMLALWLFYYVVLTFVPGEKLIVFLRSISIAPGWDAGGQS